MIYVGLTKGIINATAHWYLAVTEDGTTFGWHIQSQRK